MQGRQPPAEQRVAPLRVVARASTAIHPLADRRIAAALTYLEQHHADEVYVRELCRVTRFPRRMLERRFQAALGRSPYEELLRIRINHAKEFLATTDKPMAQVAAATGFHLKKFSTLFRRETGRTPTAYRRDSQRSFPRRRQSATS
jgi:LacI family transcriptional regulator